jgi:hypothetical protein
LTWASCECGCGFEGEDEVTQFCIEEASLIYFDAYTAAQIEAEQEAEVERNRKPGEITDPVMQQAMEEARRRHAETFGVDPMANRIGGRR